MSQGELLQPVSILVALAGFAAALWALGTERSDSPDGVLYREYMRIRQESEQHKAKIFQLEDSFCPVCRKYYDATEERWRCKCKRQEEPAIALRSALSELVRLWDNGVPFSFKDDLLIDADRVLTAWAVARKVLRETEGR